LSFGLSCYFVYYMYVHELTIVLPDVSLNDVVWMVDYDVPRVNLIRL